MSDPTPHLERFKSHEQACREFRSLIPQRFNIAGSICGRHPDAITRVALSELKPAGINTYTFGGLDFLSDKFAMSLSELGLAHADPVAVALPPSAALAVAHLGALKAGGLVVPLPVSWDIGLLKAALDQSQARFLVVDESISTAVDSFAPGLANLDHVYVVRDFRPSAADAKTRDFWSEVNRSSSDFETVESDANSPALVFYVSLKGGQLTAVVHSHASLIAGLAAFEMFTNLELDSRSILWTTGDWSSITVLLAMLYPAWWYGWSAVASASGDDLFSVIQRCEVTHAFVPTPGMRDLVHAQQSARVDSNIRLVVTDAPVSNEARGWTRNVLGGAFAAIYGAPETGAIAGTCDPWYSTPAGSIGRSVPGRALEIVDENARPVSPGDRGRIGIHRSDPGLFLRCHNDAAKAGAPLTGDCFLIGGAAHKDEAGNLFVTTLLNEEG